MKEKVILNYHLLDWVTLTIKDLIESTIEDEPNKMSTFISINNILNDIDNLSMCKISDYIGEELTNKLFEEIKNSIG